MVDLPERITGAWLNALSVEQRIEVLQGPFGRRMHTWVGSHVTFIRWATNTMFGTKIRNGSIFFLDLGGRLLAVTAAHVFQGYLSAKRKNRRILCHVQNVEFDPERRLRGLRDNIDIITFDFSYEELKKVGKQALVADAASWPPPHPFPGQGAFLAGFPGASRLWLDSRSISFGLYIASLRSIPPLMHRSRVRLKGNTGLTQWDAASHRAASILAALAAVHCSCRWTMRGRGTST